MSSSLPLISGDLLAQRYVLQRLQLDEGTAQWWSAMDRDLEREVLIKVLTADPRGSASHDAFAAEGRAASKVRHDAAIRVHDTVHSKGAHSKGAHAKDTQTKDTQTKGAGAHLIIMEAPSGTDLGSGRAATALPWERAKPILESLVEVLDAAHADGGHHGGLRPELVWVRTPVGSNAQVALTVAGFGTRLRTTPDRHLAPELRGTAELRGTPELRSASDLSPSDLSPSDVAPLSADAAPSKKASASSKKKKRKHKNKKATADVDPAPVEPVDDGQAVIEPTVASDVYGVAAIAYQLLSGGRPDGTRLHHRSNVAWPIADAVMNGLAEQPADRPPSVRAFLAHLQEGAEEPSGRGAQEAAAPTLKTRRRWNRALLLIPILGAIVAGAWFLTTLRDSDTSDGTAAAVRGTAAAPVAEVVEPPTLAPATPVPTPEPTAVPTPAATATPMPVVAIITQATPFDPPPGSGGEQDAAAPNIIDGIPGTEWSTEVYGSFNFGGLKNGVGIAVTLNQPAVLENIRLQSSTQQWQAQVYLADALGDTLDTWGTPVTDFAVTSNLEGQIDVSFAPTEAGALLIWITELGQYGGGFGVAIDEIAVNIPTP